MIWEGTEMVSFESGFDGPPPGDGNESGHSVRSPYQVQHRPNSDSACAAVALEDEIRSLRQELEDAFLESESLTSESVVEISRKLDERINQYMKFGKRTRAT